MFLNIKKSNSFLIQLAKDALVYGLGNGIKKFLGFLLLPLYTRALSPAEYGILETLGTFVLFFSVIFNMGLDSASGFYYFQPKEEKERGAILYTVFILRLITIIPTFFLSYFSTFISSVLFNSEEYSKAVIIACFLLPVNILISEQSLVYRLNRKPWKYNLLTIIRTILNLVAGILLVVNLKLGVYGAQLASLISQAIVIFYSFLTYTRFKYTYNFSLKWAKKMLKYGFPLVLGGIAVWIYQFSDRYLLLIFKDLQDVGYYSIGSSFSQPLGLLNTAIQMSWGVLFYEIYSKEDQDKKESKKAIAALVKYYLIFSCIVSFFISLFSYEIVNTFATSKYLPGIIVIPLLLYSAILSQLKEIIGIGITIGEKTIYFTYILVLSSIINLGLNFIFVPLWSFYGASLTTFIAYIANLYLTYQIAQKFFNVNYQFNKLFPMFFIFFLISSLIPLIEIKYFYYFSLPVKLLIFVLGLSFPFLFRIIRFNQILNI